MKSWILVEDRPAIAVGKGGCHGASLSPYDVPEAVSAVIENGFIIIEFSYSSIVEDKDVRMQNAFEVTYGKKTGRTYKLKVEIKAVAPKPARKEGFVSSAASLLERQTDAMCQGVRRAYRVDGALRAAQRYASALDRSLITV